MYSPSILKLKLGSSELGQFDPSFLVWTTLREKTIELLIIWLCALGTWIETWIEVSCMDTPLYIKINTANVFSIELNLMGQTTGVS
jgi:hypothetical protein